MVMVMALAPLRVVGWVDDSSTADQLPGHRGASRRSTLDRHSSLASQMAKLATLCNACHCMLTSA